VSERARDLAPYESTNDERLAFLAQMYPDPHDFADRVQMGYVRDLEGLPTEDEPESWSRSPKVVKVFGIEYWRMRGRPFDPRQRKPSEGEQRHGAADRLLWAVSGVLGALAGLWLVWSVLFG